MNLKKQQRAAIWGFIVGDALGVPYEFSERSYMKENPASSMTGFGTHNQAPGTWSDDTSMMLCVLENIMNKGSVNILAKIFIKWYDEAYLTPHGKVFDMGITTRLALDRVKLGVKATSAGARDEFSAGNGSLMRCLPYAFADDFQKSMLKMLVENKVTHQLPICNECCLFYAKVIQALANGLQKEEAVKAGGAYLRFGNRIFYADKDQPKSNFSRLFSDQFKYFPENQIQSTGYVLHTLEAVIWCFLNSSNYADAVLKAVNLGGDTDTIAALTGGLAGVYYGYDNIPGEWLKQIVRGNDIENLISNIAS